MNIKVKTVKVKKKVRSGPVTAKKSAPKKPAGVKSVVAKKNPGAPAKSPNAGSVKKAISKKKAQVFAENKAATKVIKPTKVKTPSKTLKPVGSAKSKSGILFLSISLLSPIGIITLLMMLI